MPVNATSGRTAAGRLARLAGAGLTAALLVAGMAGCASGGSSQPTATPTPTSSAAKLTGSITVFGAASLQPSFTALATSFMAANPGTTVKTSFAGSAILVTQIEQGAPADIFASADTATMGQLTAAKLIQGKPVDFATNILEIAVPKGNPANISSFADLAKPGVKTVVCAPAQPCGAATVQMEKVTGVTLTPVSEEDSVTDVLAQVTSGQADAGLVYVTDVKAAAGSVQGVKFPQSSKVVNTYPIGLVKTSANPTLARAFIGYVTGTTGQKVLKAAGFGKP
jgi:molybdate transport system substrate-binding protein